MNIRYQNHLKKRVVRLLCDLVTEFESQVSFLDSCFMGTQEGERDWVDVANDLLRKCHINLRLTKLSDCDGNVFIALYENILGEKVPDYITEPCSQEDDVHNVQSVIDSLALDYLQISLSHITGENIVRGDKESIKNLLEIFDGLLEYLSEELIEELQSGEVHDDLTDHVHDGAVNPWELQNTQQEAAMLEGESPSSSEQSVAKSSVHSHGCWSAEETGLANELIELGDSARTFTAKQDAPPLQSTPLPSPLPSTKPLPSAIPLQPPYQTTTKPGQHKAPALPAPIDEPPEYGGLNNGPQGLPAGPVAPEQASGTVEPPSSSQQPSPALSATSASGQQRSRKLEEAETLEPTHGGAKRVLFRTQPDVLLVTLPEDTEPAANSPPDTEEEEEDDSATLERERRGEQITRGVFSEDEGEDALSHRRKKNLEAERELHHMSEKLSRRLQDLDQMLKRVLEEGGDSSQVLEDGQQSQHSEGYTHTDTPRPRAERRACTPPRSPSPPQRRGSLQAQLEGPVRGSQSPGDRRQTNLSTAASARRCRAELGHRERRRHTCQQPVNKAYEEELMRYEVREEARLAQERLRAQEAEREYREAILRDLPKTPRSAPGRREKKAPPQSRSLPRPPRKAPPMKVKENDLLPVLLQEFPLLQLSPHGLAQVWQQQMGQVDRLHSLSASTAHRHRRKLASQVEDAQRKQELLVEIIRKEQEHNKRLRDGKEHLQQQRSAQNRLKEQRQQVARAKQYHSNYHVQLRARLTRERSKEEKMFREVFAEGLELQKARLNEQRSYAREQRLEQQRRHLDHISSMENYYRGQFSLLAETLAQERQEIQVRKKAQQKALLKMKRELCSRMKREIGQLQSAIVQNDEDDFFQDLEVQRLRKRLQMASFQFNNSGLR